MRTQKAMAIVVMSLGMILAGSGSARADMKRIESDQVIVPAGGYLYCKATVDNSSPVDLTVTLMRGARHPRRMATEFGTHFVQSPLASESGLYYTEVRAGAFGPANRGMIGSCVAEADGTFDSGVEPKIVACGCSNDSGNPGCDPCLR